MALATLVGFTGLAASSLDTSFNIGTGANGIVEQVLPLSNGKILICGNFTSFNGKNRSYIARLNSDGSVDESFLAQPSYWVRNMSLQADGKIVIGGYFKSVQGQPRNLVARLNTDGSVDTTFNPGLGAHDIIAGGIDGNIDPFVFWTAVQPDGKILITGNFRNYNGSSSVGLARINPNGSRDATFNVGQGLNSWGRHILVLSNGQILVSGWLTAYNGVGYNRMVRINPDGSADSSFKPFIGDKTAIYSTAEVGGGKIIGAGHSLNEEGLFKREMARFNVDGSIDPEFVGFTNDKTESVVIQPDGKVIVVGSFSQVNGTQQKCLARFFPNGTVDSSLRAEIDNYVWGAALQADGKLLISGGFWTVDGQSRNGVARFHTGVTPGPQPELPPALSASAVSSSQINLAWSDGVSRTGYTVERKVAGGTYADVGSLAGSARSFSSTGLSPSTQYLFRLRTKSSSGTTIYSNEASATTLAASGGGGGANSAAFVGTDTITRGTWKGVYGGDGYIVIGEVTKNASYATVTPTGKSDWTWTWSTTDEDALQRANGTDRLAACWYSGGQFSIEVNITDGQKHRLALYFLDWDAAGRSQTVQVWDGATGGLLGSQAVSGFSNGKWLQWDVSGKVRFTVQHSSGPNAVISGVFLGPAGTGTTQQPAATPVISPNGGSYTSAQSVTITTATTGAEIRYTTNGAEPTTTSALYSGPFTLSASATVKAKAFKSGMLPSATASAAFTISTGGGSTGGTTGGTGETKVRFLGIDTTTKGNWRGVYGADGYNVIAKSLKNPSYVQIALAGKLDWIWNDTTSDTRALLNAEGTSRMPSCYYSAGSFDISLNFTDGGTHKFSLYCLDWDNLGRSEKVEILDGATGAVLHSTTLSAFSGGQYLNWDLKGNVKVRVTKLVGPNGVVSGYFFGPASAPL